ncbi:hypothetical protein OSTOST_10380 [Ostertagia ostertagi]
MSMHMMTGSGGPMMFPHQMQAGPSGLGQMMPVGPQCSMPNNMVPQPGVTPTLEAAFFHFLSYISFNVDVFRTFSNSPESLDIPRLVLTNPEGTNGSHFECFNDLQHITLDANDMQMLCNGTGNGNPVQQENRFHAE